MTQQSDNITSIDSEEDVPLTPNHSQPASGKDVLPSEKDIEQGLSFQKFSLGSATLGWCIFLMLVCVILSIAFPGNSLVESAFEAFKLIVMTILGYIFGSNSSGKGEG